MNGETPPKTTEAERFDAAMRRALERYDRLSGPGARLHDYVPLKTLEREECIYAIRDALAQRERVNCQRIWSHINPTTPFLQFRPVLRASDDEFDIE